MLAFGSLTYTAELFPTYHAIHIATFRGGIKYRQLIHCYAMHMLLAKAVAKVVCIDLAKSIYHLKG